MSSASISPARGAGRDRRPRGGGPRGKADMHLHTLWSDGTAAVAELLDWVEEATDLDVIAITDHERIDGAQRALELHARGGYGYDLVVGEEVTTRRGHLLGLFLTDRVRALRPLPESLAAIHAQGGIAIAAHPLAPLTPSIGARSLRAAHETADPALRLDGIELMNPSAAGRSRRAARNRLNAELLHLPAVGNSDAHVLEAVGTAWTWFDGASAAEYRSSLAAGTTEPAGDFWTNWHNVSVYGRQLVAKGRHLRHTLRPTGEWR
jgi:predicted metal-dependent phosphoesterase TrpH